MRVQKIIYGKSFEMYGYWEKLNLEIEVEEGETAEKVLDQAKYIVDEWHRANPASVYSAQNRKRTMGEEGLPVIQVEKIRPKPDAAIMQLYMDAITCNDYSQANKLLEIYDIKTEEDYAAEK